jgi:hypothetical protein
MPYENRRSSADSRRISIGRLIAATLAALLTAVAAFFAYGAYDLDRQFYEALDARPISLEVNLSQPGEFSAPFTQTYTASHGESIHLLVELPAGSTCVTAEQLAGLDARMVIVDVDGNKVVDQKLAAPTDCGPREDEALPLAYFHPFSVGEYTATITVAQGAPALRGTKQTLYAKYHLCGLERFPIYIARMFAAICGLPAFILGAIVVRGFVKYGVWKHLSAEQVPGGDCSARDDGVS